MPKESKKDTKVSKRADDGKKRRAKKDPNAPKRGLSAYMFFSQAHRKTVQEENPEAGFGQIGKILGDKWKAMTDKDKEPYIAQAETDKKRYEKEKAAHDSKDEE
ncbi:unnamed protein product [Umbelopsis ramanniana]